MRKEAISYFKLHITLTFVALCVALALLLGGCSRTVMRTEKAETRAADAPVETHKTSTASPVRVSAEGTEAAEPTITTGADGAIYVAWVEHGTDGKADVWLSRYDGEGRASSPSARVNSNAGEATAWRGDPPTLAVTRDGTVYVGWTARDETAAHTGTLYLSSSRDGGRSFGPPSKVNDDRKPGVHGMHSLAVSGDGRIYMAWLDERNVVKPKPSKGGPVHMHSESNREVFFASSGDGGHTFSPNLKVAGEVCPCCKTSLVAGDDGRIYMAWRQVLPSNFRHIGVASSIDGGKSFSPTAIVSDDHWEIQGCPVSGPALAVAADNSLRVLWYTAGEAGKPGLYWSESSDGGRTFSQRRTLAETGGHGTPVLLKDAGGAFKAVWEGSDGTTPVTVMAGLKGDGQPTESSMLANGGALPAAVEVGGQVFIAYIGESGGNHAIWLTRAAVGADSRDGKAPSTVAVYRTRGVVKAINREKGTVRIDH
ncbi:MAG: sialidase family protein, partial [Pyrinomonadaceae bacterium]